MVSKKSIETIIKLLKEDKEKEKKEEFKSLPEVAEDLNIQKAAEKLSIIKALERSKKKKVKEITE